VDIRGRMKEEDGEWRMLFHCENCNFSKITKHTNFQLGNLNDKYFWGGQIAEGTEMKMDQTFFVVSWVLMVEWRAFLKRVNNFIFQ
jgi:hypothetical protein